MDKTGENFDQLTIIATKNFNGRVVKYSIDQFGVIHQVDPHPFVYDAKYSAIYDRDEYQRESHILMALRLGFIHGAIPAKDQIRNLVDFGYGNGAFLKMAQRYYRVTGYDITGVNIDGIRTINGFDHDAFLPTAGVYTMWDVIEHIPVHKLLPLLDELKHKTKYLVISTPNCHWDHTEHIDHTNWEWFINDYYHLKPDEHVNHFTPHTLQWFMDAYGWHLVKDGDYEDVVRKGKLPGQQNIFTMVFRSHL